MYFESFSAFIAMGGHGFYVWSAYLLSMLLLVFLLVKPVIRQRGLLREAQRAFLIEEKRGGQQ
ncbi:MAG: heme exporter protein CcmD [Pseudomonadales bacterium]|nr:heme exporter protein CcmD [Pseudomonadales bacterium]